jgi:hypothetical protein
MRVVHWTGNARSTEVVLLEPEVRLGETPKEGAPAAGPPSSNAVFEVLNFYRTETELGAYEEDLYVWRYSSLPLCYPNQRCRRPSIPPQRGVTRAA